MNKVSFQILITSFKSDFNYFKSTKPKIFFVFCTQYTYISCFAKFASALRSHIKTLDT